MPGFSPLFDPMELAVPQQLIDALIRYKRDRIPPGSFLRAVLENNLREAVGNADIHSQRALCAIVAWCYNNLPSGSWGTPERVSKWLEKS
jgi:hypothetical protein